MIEGPYECVAEALAALRKSSAREQYVSTVQEGGFMTGEFEGKMTLPD